MKKYSYVSQIDMRDCGVAALSSIIRHYGSYYSLAKLRQLAKTNMSGTSAFGIIEAAKTLNFDVEAVQADMTLFELENIPFPFIAHVNKKQKYPHYYVVYGMSKNKIVIGDPDPSVKITKLSLDKFSSEWTGVAIFIAPGPNYKIFKEKKHGLLQFIPNLRKHISLIKKIIILSLAVTFISIIGSYYLQEALDYYIPQKNYSLLNIVTLSLVITYIVQQILFYLKQYFLEKLSLQLTSDLFLDYLKHIFDLPIDFFSTRRTGEIISRFTDATTIIDAIASTLLSIFLDFTVLLAVGGTLLIQNQMLFFLTIICIPIYSLIILFFFPSLEKMNHEVMHENASLNSLLIEDINGIETIKSLSGEEARFNHLHQNFSAYTYKSLKISKIEFFQQSLKQATKLILNIIILWIGAKLVIDQKLSIGQLITYNTLLIYFIDPLENIINLQTKLQAAKVANERLNEVYLVKSEHQEPLYKIENQSKQYNIEIKHLNYQYGFNSAILQDINLTISYGEKITFIGSSGSGKTTLAKLLVRFFEPTSGELSINGINYTKIDKKSLRKLINYLPQQAYVFNGTILDNLTLGLSTNITKEQIDSACRVAEILDDINNLPLSFNTEITDGLLSGGQKQCLAIARALLTNAPILILDESTSNLDIVKEQNIINNLLNLTSKTIIFIAHRLSIAEKSERIIVLDNGRIVETGTHDELIKKNGHYNHLINY